MCGIVGAIAEREVSGILLEGLRRLEYRGYDSAGIALVDGGTGRIRSAKAVGKVEKLAAAAKRKKLGGRLGIAHTRWATHGRPTVANAHPHFSDGRIAIVHNGIIENHEELRAGLVGAGYSPATETDSEVIAHLIHRERRRGKASLADAAKAAIKKLKGAYGLCVFDAAAPEELIAARSGSPLVVGVGIGEHFVASDPAALGQVTDRFVFLEEGDIIRVTRKGVEIWQGARRARRPVATVRDPGADAGKGRDKHYMLKEINEQPQAIRDTLAGRISVRKVLEQAFGVGAGAIFDRTKSVQIVACGTSFHAGQVAKYWLESIARIPCQVDIASDYRYRDVIVRPGALFVAVSQSGETADTLAALRHAKGQKYVATLAICNVAVSSLVRESDFCLLTMAGREVSVASTKAFTTQLCLLLILAIVLARRTGLRPQREAALVKELARLPGLVEKTLRLGRQIRNISRRFSDKHHSLFLGRGVAYPVAKEGALKLKEVSYIHAEAYPAGELKHGPLALVDEKMPVVAVAPNNELLSKLKANLSEVSARGGRLYVFADESIGFESGRTCKVVHVPKCANVLDPVVFTIPLQLLAYYVAIFKGTDVDHPRNLAKSVTVE